VDERIKDLYEVLIREIRKYRPDKSLEMIYNAFNFAYEAHKEQFRKTGEPYITHPLSVAIILASIRTDMESISAALLHDVIEDTDATYEDVVAAFGEEVALLVVGVTKIEKVAYVSKTERQAENYRRMFFHISQDVRVLLVKIADRLHNMQTLEGHSEEKQRAIAQETLDIYAPLAHRLGISKLRYELEELGFKYSDGKVYEELSQRVQIKQSERQEIVEQIMKEIRAKLEEDGVKATIEGRPKRFYSIYKKMMSKERTLDQIFDLYAVRVLVDEVSECYEVLGRLHEMYTPVPGRFKDFIGMRKQNGYQSLHTTLIGPGEPFEVQVRTHQMHSVAEYGIAAHWKYKESGKLAKDKWLQGIMDLQRDMSGSEDFIDALKMDLDAFSDRIYCFTPKGELIALPGGSCPIDYAYAIHSAVGNRMIGARVNGKIVPLDYELQTGDQVEILTSQNAKGPSRDWIKLVKTNTARTKITQWFNKESREENIRKGREALEAVMSELETDKKITLDELLTGDREIEVLERYNCKNMEQLYVLIGVGGLREKLVANHLFREYEKTLPPPSNEELIQSLLDVSEKQIKNKQQSGVIIDGVGDTTVRFARCCGPLPGDEILGYVTRGRGLTVHRTDCINVIRMDDLDRRRLMEARWKQGLKREASFHTEMRIDCNNRDGLLLDISRVLQEEKAIIKTVNMRTVQSEAVVHLGLEVADGRQLEFLTKKLRNVPDVCEITRVSS